MAIHTQELEEIAEVMLRGLKNKLINGEQLTASEVTFLTTVLKQNGIKAKGGNADVQNLINTILNNKE